MLVKTASSTLRFPLTGERVAVKILENIAENVEEIQVEFKILRDLCHHPNLPLFHGVFLRRAPVMEQDQLWFVLEVKDTIPTQALSIMIHC